MEVSKEQEINQMQMGRPHVVILGAGASYASFPNGDINGVKLPLMNNFVSTLEINDLLYQTGVNFDTENFETAYDHLCQNNSCRKIREELESKVYDYFSQLEISAEPSIYDHLLLSLREKDVVATFNWDPFLLQAYRRNAQILKLPRLLFLHGNVGVGYCDKDRVAGLNGNKCSKCGRTLMPSKLLYPIAEKNYHLDGFISSQWHEMEQHLKEAFMITIFGYGAPQSDVSAIDQMKAAWGDINNREMEQTEIIDIRSEEDLYKAWEPFIHTHHYDTHSSFYNSWIANHPRRTGEAHINQHYDAQFIENNPIPKDFHFPELWAWFEKFKIVEEQHNGT